MKCNQCGKELAVKNGILQEDGLFVAKQWGYFSQKDLTTDTFCLCEACYDAWIAGFKIPIKRENQTEAM